MARRTSKKAKTLGAVVLLVMVSMSTFYYFAWRNWNQFQVILGEDFVKRAGASSGQSVTVTYNLVEGWNFIAFPMEPITVKSAAEVIKDVADAGGYVTMISRWNGDRWQELAQRGVEQYGNDFPLVPGEAYFVRNEKAVEWNVSGTALARDSKYGKVVLHPGWNAVGLNPISVVDARGVLDTLSKDGIERASEIDKWYSGNWQMLVKRWYSAENVQEYGDNFKLDGSHGYMIRAANEITLDTVE